MKSPPEAEAEVEIELQLKAPPGTENTQLNAPPEGKREDPESEQLKAPPEGEKRKAPPGL